MEDAKFVSEDVLDNGVEYFAYSSKVATLSAFIGYYFVEDKLYSTRYIFNDKHSNKNDYVSDFKKINEILIDKYGEPDDTDTIWKNDLYKNRPQDYGLAVSIGHLVYYSSWKNDETTITLLLSGNNYKIQHNVQYVSKSLKSLVEKASEKKNKSIF